MYGTNQIRVLRIWKNTFLFILLLLLLCHYYDKELRFVQGFHSPLLYNNNIRSDNIKPFTKQLSLISYQFLSSSFLHNNIKSHNHHNIIYYHFSWNCCPTFKKVSPHPRQASSLSTRLDSYDVDDEGKFENEEEVVDTSIVEQKNISINNEINIRRNENKNHLLFSIGIVADIQYAPIDDGHSYSGNERYYRNALDVAKIAAQHFESEDHVDYVINLGDIVDGKCKTIIPTNHEDNDNNNNNESKEGSNNNNISKSSSIQAVNDVLDALSYYKKGTMIHTYGNHCLYNMNRYMIQSKLNIPFIKEKSDNVNSNTNRMDDSIATTDHNHILDNEELVGYYTILLKNNIRIVVLDSYDISLLQRDSKTSMKYQNAYNILTINNPKNMKENNENSPDGLIDLERRYVAFNGGIGNQQLLWFDTILSLSKQNNEKVIIISHQPIHPKSCHPSCLIWNYIEVINIMNQYNDIILGSFSGHAHKGGYYNQNNIHYRVVEAVLENIPSSYIIVDIYNNNEIHIRGYGNCQSQIWEHNNINNSPTITTTTTTTTIISTQPQQRRRRLRRVYI